MTSTDLVFPYAMGSRVNPGSSWILALFIFVVFVGILTRFTSLGEKVYWHDETYSSLRIFGHTGDEYHSHLFDGKIHTVADVQAYQHPNSDFGIGDTLRALASRPEHPPLYYLLGWLWTKLFNDPVIALRSLSAMFGLLMLPALYWFMWELFFDKWVSWSAVVLATVSPLHLLYAQEARQYSLWVTIVLFSSVFFLYALRSSSQRAWYGYTLLMGLGLYTQITFALIAVCHIFYLVSMPQNLRTKGIKPLLSSLAIAFFLFIPWLLLFLFSIPDVVSKTEWMRTPAPWRDLFYSWLMSINRLFFDFPGSALMIPFSVSLSAVSIAVVVRWHDRQFFLLPVLFLIVGAGFVILPDLLTGGRRSMETRYLLPALVAIELGVACAIGYGLKSGGIWSWLNRVAAIVIVVLGLYSQMVILTSGTWWNKSVSERNKVIAAIINREERPLLITMMGDINPGEILSLSYLLKDEARLLLLSDLSLPKTLPEGSKVFVLNPSWIMGKLLKSQFGMDLIDAQGRLWVLNETH